MQKRNLFDLTGSENISEELFETLAKGSAHIERIISHGQTTPEGSWYDQSEDEWVVLLQGEAEIEFEDMEVIRLSKGDFILIGAHQKHRVTYTSTLPPCIWLAVHGIFT